MASLLLVACGDDDDTVTGEPGVESFTLRSVERTILCRRGVSEDGLCV